ncbi:terminase gpA endonuclease subunit [Sphingopyxis sp.]|uniref:phage terminase large subunit family protein n=1 Tax=Sphingopyxis sp. TaxID=1908224 RepID=UPI0025D29B3B|nr:terminase gpA endonuclease subunit [Sphingopyxis sp.]
MDLSGATAIQQTALAESLAAGLAAFAVPHPMSLGEWAAKHFYLSAESSYVEQAWQAWPYQDAIMACISNDDIEEVDWQKAARTGNTKIMLAAIGYFAEHKRRNQAMWQPTDDDRTEFVKTELDPMLRDVAIMQHVFPAYLSRHRDNTLTQKTFLGSVLHLRGGKAAKNYRRISIDVGYIDEADAFDRDIENEGDPYRLAAKRVEGATFKKMIVGSTPKSKGFSLIEDRTLLADERFAYAIPCPHCGEMHPITWGGKAESHGFKWRRLADGSPDPDSVRHLCPHCGALIAQGEYLAVWRQGIYRNERGDLTLDRAGTFRDASGASIQAPRHVAFVGVWTAYSPAANWADIVRDFHSAHEKIQAGDKGPMKSFTNTTLGQPWEETLEKTDAEEIKSRAEPYALRTVPMNCVLLLCSVDTQDNRLEATVRGYGRGCQTWTVAHEIYYGSPGEDAVWNDLEELIFDTEFQHASGSALRIHATAIDSGGHFTPAVYDFAYRHRARSVFALRGSSGREKHIKNGVQKVDIDWRGRIKKRGLLLWHVGTNLAKDLLHSRIELTRPGPGYMHFSQDLPDEWFAQLAGEARAARMGVSGNETRWVALRKRVEAWDCAVYIVWLETHLDLARKSGRFWDDLEARVQPPTRDLFAPESAPEIAPPPAALPPPRKVAPRIPHKPLMIGW